MANNTIQAEIDSIDLAPPKLSVERYDQLIDFVIAPQGAGIVGSIIQAVKLICIVSYVIAREILVRGVIADKQKKLAQLIRSRSSSQNEV